MIRGAVGDTGIAYRVDGTSDGPALVFSNSLGTDHRLWDRQMPAVEERFRIVRYEACGHGVSDPPRGPVTIERLALDLLRSSIISISSAPSSADVRWVA